MFCCYWHLYLYPLLVCWLSFRFFLFGFVRSYFTICLCCSGFLFSPKTELFLHVFFLFLLSFSLLLFLTLGNCLHVISTLFHCFLVFFLCVCETTRDILSFSSFKHITQIVSRLLLAMTIVWIEEHRFTPQSTVFFLHFCSPHPPKDHTKDNVFIARTNANHPSIGERPPFANYFYSSSTSYQIARARAFAIGWRVAACDTFEGN